MNETQTSADRPSRFAVVGDPIAHSRSPAIHMAAYGALRVDATYRAIRVQAGQFCDVVEWLEDGELDGVNVTMPLKADAFRSVHRRSPRAERAGSVNTVKVAEGELEGANTDVDGVVHAINKLSADSDAPVLILGAGGAARAAVVAVEGRDIAVSARRSDAARSVLDTTGASGVVVAWDTAVPGAIVVNATPLGMHGERLPSQVLDEAVALVDMAYGDSETAAVEAAKRAGVPVADGLDMLVGQAAAAFTIFVGEAPPMEVMETAARSVR